MRAHSHRMLGASHRGVVTHYTSSRVRPCWHRLLHWLRQAAVIAVMCSIFICSPAAAGGYGLQSSFGMQGQVPGSRYGSGDAVNWPQP
jgi:hypothetical protein